METFNKTCLCRLYLIAGLPQYSVDCVSELFLENKVMLTLWFGLFCLITAVIARNFFFFYDSETMLTVKI